MLVNCLPDTGCSQTILSAQLARQLCLSINNNNGVQLFTANGGIGNIEGTSPLIIRNNDISITSAVIVASNLSHSALISWHDMVALKIISPSFPARVAAISAIDIKEQVFNQFPSVFCD